jgi:pimeloyl-ACP methyl ester carboxylesterase
MRRLFILFILLFVFSGLFVSFSQPQQPACSLIATLFFDGSQDPQFSRVAFQDIVVDSQGRLIIKAINGQPCGFGSCYNLYSLSPNGTLNWSRISVGTTSHNLLFGPDDRVYFFYNGAISAFDSSGNPAPGWPVTLPYSIATSNQPVVVDQTDGAVYARSGVTSSFSGFPVAVQAFNSDGTQKWRVDYADGNIGSAGIYQGPLGNLYTFVQGIGFHSLSRNNSDLVCTSTANVGGEVGTADGVFTGGAGGIFVVRGDCSSETFYALPPGMAATGLVDDQGRVFGYDYQISPFDFSVARFFATSGNGTLLWRNQVILPNAIGPDNPIRAFRNGIAYVLGDDTTEGNKHKLFLLDENTGQILNCIETAPLSANPGVAVAPDGTIYLYDRSSTKIYKIGAPVSPCSLSCPSDMALSNDAGQCGAIVNYPTPMLMGSCGAVTCTPPSGSFFPIGTITIACPTTAGPTCSFTVTIMDAQAPFITCASDITVAENPRGSGSAIVNYPAPTVSDNCATATSCTPSSGSIFQIGVTTVTCTATDGSDNTGLCSFTVTVTGPPLFGTVGIWDGKGFWPLDGDTVNLAVTATPVRGGREFFATLTKPDYRFDGLPPGEYDLVLTLTYRDRISVDNLSTCNNKNAGCHNQVLLKTSKLKVKGMQIPSIERHFIRFPVPLVMVHGILSCFEKWYAFQGTPQASGYWDNYARSQGFISFTPNYHYLVNSPNSWGNVATEVEDQIQENFKALSRSVNDTSYPEWVYIGHSQGGLVARALTSTSSTGGTLASSLRKIFLLGTPNSGGLAEVFGGYLACTPYLGRIQMESDFNLLYPNFGGKDVTVYAGTHCASCKVREGDNDQIVPVDSAHNIYQRPNGCLFCTPEIVLSLPGKDFFYTHFELGSPESRLEILAREILPQVRTSTN